MNNRTLPHLSDTQLLGIVRSYQRTAATPEAVHATRYQDAVKALHERGYVVDLATETQEVEAVRETDTFPAVQTSAAKYVAAQTTAWLRVIVQRSLYDDAVTAAATAELKRREMTGTEPVESVMLPPWPKGRKP